MKFKKYIYLLGLIIGLIGFNACQEDTLIEPSPSPEVPEGCIGVYFPKTNVSSYEFEPDEETTIELTLSRFVTSGASEVPLIVEVNTDDVFNVPAKAIFASGEETTTVKVTFPSAAEGKPYSLSVKLEGDEYVNPYSVELPYMTTTVTRIKWDKIEKPMVYVDGTFQTLYGVEQLPIYVYAEKASLGSSVKYRFKNIYSVPTGEYKTNSEGKSVYTPIADEDGIYDGFYYNEPGDFDDKNTYYTIIEINDKEGKSGDVSMEPHDIGTIWSYGMISIGTVYGNLSTNINTYPLGSLKDGKVTFPLNSLYFSMKGYNDGGKYPANGAETLIYFTKEAYIADNMKIGDFNEVEYEAIEGEIGEFESKAFNEVWNKTIKKAIDIDEDNVESEYKDLYYIADLYEDDFGLAFYYDGKDKISIVNNQPTGAKVFGKDLYVSESESVKSSVYVNSKGVTVYTFGLSFHYKDGTKLGDFEELYFYSKDAVSYSKEDFIGNFSLTGPSQFGGEPAAKMDVKFSEGDDANILILEGVDWAKEIVATFNPDNSTISIKPQKLADIERKDGSIWNDVTLYTTDLEGEVSSIDPMIFTFNMQGNVVISSDTKADGYLIRSVIAGGWLDGYHSIQFAPAPAPKSTRSAYLNDISVKSFESAFAREDVKVGNNFRIQNKTSFKTVKSNVTRVSL